MLNATTFAPPDPVRPFPPPGIQIKQIPTEELLSNVVGLDWTRLAEMNVQTRSAEDCRIQWIGNDHPLIHHTEFTEYARR